MAELSEWIINSPYTDEERNRLTDSINRVDSDRVFEPDEHVDWLINTTKRFMKGTFLEQEHVPFTRSVQPWTFGYESGPIFSFETATLHEIGHAIQLKKAQYKSRVGNFQRFRRPKSSCQTIMGREYYEPVSIEGSLVEAEAIGINLVLLEMLGYEIDKPMYYQDWAYTLRHTQDWYAGRDDRLTILQMAIEMQYLIWKNQRALMEQRYKNFCEYVGKQRRDRPDAYYGLE